MGKKSLFKGFTLKVVITAAGISLIFTLTNRADAGRCGNLSWAPWNYQHWVFCEQQKLAELPNLTIHGETPNGEGKAEDIKKQHAL